MSEKDRLLSLCIDAMKTKNKISEKHKARVLEEIREINSQNGHEYVLDVYDKLRATKSIYPENQPNLLIYELLDIAVPADLESPPVYKQGEYPDIDSDFIKPVQVYLKD